MSRWLRYLAGLALALPMGAYVAGSLIASANDEPGPRSPVHLEQRPAGGSDRDAPDPVPIAESAGPEKARGEDAAAEGQDDEQDDEQDDGDDGDDGSPTDDDGSAVDDNGIRVVKPEPSRLDKGDDEDDDAGDDAGDDSRDGDDAGGDDSGNSGASRDD